MRMQILQEVRAALAPSRLDELAGQNQAGYQQARPFPHLVLDGFLPESVLDLVLDEFPSSGESDWYAFDDRNQKKLASNSESKMGEHTSLLLQQLNSSTVIDFLKQLTGIEGLIPDPHFRGGGLHQIERGGHLAIHSDFNHNDSVPNSISRHSLGR
jgi:hypothetical protein